MTMSDDATAERGDGERLSTRDSLLAAASALMRSRDTLSVSISDIAAEAGVNSALVKYYFGNKNGLMLALLERDLSLSITQLRDLVAMDMRPAAKMRYHLSGLIRIYFRFPYLQRLLISIMRDESEEVGRQIAETYLSPIAQAYETMIAEGVDVWLRLLHNHGHARGERVGQPLHGSIERIPEHEQVVASVHRGE